VDNQDLRRFPDNNTKQYSVAPSSCLLQTSNIEAYEEALADSESYFSKKQLVYMISNAASRIRFKAFHVPIGQLTKRCQILASPYRVNNRCYIDLYTSGNIGRILFDRTVGIRLSVVNDQKLTDHKNKCCGKQSLGHVYSPFAVGFDKYEI
jgi:hypothetical protein